MTGATAAAAAARQGRASGGKDRPEKDRRAADDALWTQAARWHAAAEGRRQARAPGQARGTGVPSGQTARREPFRPWFTDSAGDELWLSAEGTGEPWFTRDGEGER